MKHFTLKQPAQCFSPGDVTKDPHGHPPQASQEVPVGQRKRRKDQARGEQRQGGWPGMGLRCKRPGIERQVLTTLTRQPCFQGRSCGGWGFPSLPRPPSTPHGNLTGNQQRVCKSSRPGKCFQWEVEFSRRVLQSWGPFHTINKNTWLLAPFLKHRDHRPVKTWADRGGHQYQSWLEWSFVGGQQRRPAATRLSQPILAPAGKG